jgi:hypothetical protein
MRMRVLRAPGLSAISLSFITVLLGPIRHGRVCHGKYD